MTPSDGEFFRTMIARVSPEDIVLYANSALAAYLRVSKADLTGAPLEILASRTRGEISACFQRPETGRASNRLVTDESGRVFEVKTYSEGGVLDIVLDEVTTMESVSRDLRHVSGTSVDLLNEEELRTARQPERRFLTVSQVRMNGISRLAERLAPMEMRLIMNSFVEESADAILETGCTYYESSGGSVTGIFGAPRYFADHSLRAVQAACIQLEKSAQLRSGLFRQGREMPPLSCGIWTGDTFIGTLGASATQSYSAVGLTVDLAGELSKLARPGEVLISEFTLRNLVQTLPGGWQALQAESETEPDLSDFHWPGELVVPLPEEFVRKVWLIGPGVEEDASRAEYFADYLYALKTEVQTDPVPVLRVVRPAAVGDSLELSGDNVVTSQFSQSLGKYKLLSVVGTGGMGKVWKGQDRFGNTVAIKVLHSTEGGGEALIKRFQREAEIMSRLPHRNICRVFEMNEFEGIQYLVMEFVDGLTLADLLYEQTSEESSGSSTKALPDLKSLISALRTERSTRGEAPAGPQATEESVAAHRAKRTRVLPVEQTLNIFLKVCDAVQFAHEHGVLHRDLKPGNILLREDGEPLVADFGLAKIRTAEAGQSLSVSGNVVGTLENMSPEQAESSKDVDERADVYALGTILYQMLTGCRHFDATGNIVADAQALQTHEPKKPRLINPKIDTDLEIIVLKALRNSPAERYRSVAALESDIERYRKGEIISARPVSALELLRKLVLRNRAVTAVITASLVIFLAGSVAAFWQITDRAKAAEAALKEAERQSALARKNELLAEEQKRQAEQRQQEAQDALDKLTAEQSARQQAESAKSAALSESAEAKKLREEAEARAVLAAKQAEGADEELSRANKKIEALEARAITEQEPRPAPRRREPDFLQNPENFIQANMAMNEALMAFHQNLNPGVLGAYAANPEMILRRITTGLGTVSGALLLDPTLSQAWIVKGRYHLACMETQPAKDAFEMADQVASARRQEDKPDLLGPERPSELAAICDQLLQPSANRFQKASELLSKTGSQSDEITAGVIRFLEDKPGLRRSTIGASPFGRTPDQTEIAAGIMAANRAAGKIEFRSGGKEIAISGMPSLRDLSLLKSLSPQPSAVAISGANALDWATLATLPLEGLDLSGCPISDYPVTLRGFAKVQRLSLKDTHFAELGLVRLMPLLSSLDVSGTSVQDLSQLAMLPWKRLQVLDISRIALDNVRPLATLPLTRLTLSPLMISDKASLKALQTHRTLRFIGAPGDPENQTAAEFWRKLDAGEYDTGT